MFFECANPACHADFDYRQGAIYRFPRQLPHGTESSHTLSVEHLWLCSNCAKVYRLDYDRRRGVLLSPLFAKLAWSEFVPLPVVSAR
jgi:hypothetical protein